MNDESLYYYASPCQSTSLRQLQICCDAIQVVGAFLEGGSNEENDAMKKAAVTQPSAPENLGSEGLAFASKL